MHKKKYSINGNNQASIQGSIDPSDQEEEQTNFYKDTQAVIKSQLKKRKGMDEDKNMPHANMSLERQTNDRQLRMNENEVQA